MQHPISFEELRRILHYDPETGIFTWLIRPAMNTPAGTVAGSINNKGRRVIHIGRRLYTAGRLAWFYMTGAWPHPQVDHINGCRLDDRFENLRQATNQQNAINRGTRCDNTSGIKGIHWIRHIRKWQARINVNGQRVNLGYFADIEEAKRVRREAASRHYGEFAREHL